MKWTKSLLACLAMAGLYALAEGKSGGLPAAESVSAAETTAADGPAIQTAGAAIALSALEHLTDSAAAPEVYFTADISAEGLLEIYQALGWNPQGPVAVKLSTGEPPASNYLRPELIGDLVKSLNGTIVEYSTAYGGSRASAALHKQVAQDHGFTAIADFDLMDEDGETALPLTGGVRLNRAIVGSHIDNYDSFLILSYFKGHAMSG